MWSPAQGVLRNYQDSMWTPGTFWLCPRHLKMYLESWWSPSGVPLEYQESSGVHTERVGQCKDLI